MDEPSPDLRPLYGAAPDVAIHHGQIWAGTPPEFFDYIDAHFDFRPDDVWLISFPRSGTTWTYEIAHAVLQRGDIAALRAAQDGGKILKFIPLEIGIRTAAALPERVAAWKSLPSPRVIPTHMPPRLFPNRARGSKLITVVRDPRDVAVSLYHLHRSHKLLGSYQGPWSEFFDCFIAGNVAYGSWLAHTRAWAAYADAHPATVLRLQYEAMKHDFTSQVDRLAGFLGIDLPAARIAAIAEHTSFRSMSGNPFTNREGNPVMDFSIARFLRKGEVGDWQQQFTPEQTERIAAAWGAALREIGLYSLSAPSPAA